MRLLQKWIEKIQRFSATHGYSCDGCGKEIFTYPSQRFCQNCQNKLHRNDKRVCEKCGRQTVAEGVCLTCKHHLPSFTQGLSPFVYQSQTAQWVNRMKNGKRRLAYYFAEEMSALFQARFPLDSPLGRETLLVIPVPMSETDKLTRGFNQAELLAKWFVQFLQEKEYDVVLDTDVLHKIRETRPQKRLRFYERAENVAGAFHVHKRAVCKDKTILLVDDILTTGATANECSSRLFGAGAKNVFFLTIASLPEQK